MTIAELLQLSREAHLRYRESISRRVPDGAGGTIRVEGDPVVAGAALTEACRLRVEAHALDPDHVDPAWREEPVTHDHDTLLTFYGDQLSR